MKLIFLILVLVAVIYGCRDDKSPDMIREFIPGTYIRYSKHEFGEEYDTISISVQSSTANMYEITRRWKYERVGESPKYELTSTLGFRNEDENVLGDLDTGDVISFDIAKHCLFIGITKYDKL